MRRAAGGSRSCGFEVGLPAVEGHGVPGSGFASPQFARFEDHRIEPLWVFAQLMGIGIGKHMAPNDAVDDAGSAAEIRAMAAEAGEN